MALIGLLKAVMSVSVVGMGVMLIIAWAMSSLDGLIAQMFLTFVAMFFGSLLTQVQLSSTRRRSMTRPSGLQVLGGVVIVVSQASFLTLVWTGWTTHTAVWRIWWISMVPSVFVTHLILNRAARRPGDGKAAEQIGVVCIVWVGLMILWLGIRGDMFGNISPVYLWIGAVPATGTVVCTLILVMRRFVRVGAPRPGSKRGLVAGVLMSHMVLALAGYYIGRASTSRGDDPKEMLDTLGTDVSKQLDRDVYALMSHIAEYLGDTKIIGREPFITVEQIDGVVNRLQPGDIILERRNWYLSNPFLPGFWPHAALYIGTPEQLEPYGVLDYPSMQEHLEELQTPADDGRPRTIIESVSEGVVLMSATHSLRADYVAVLRPRLTRAEIGAAIVQAFEHKGKPYDFRFDFDDRDKIVCTQLIYEAYRGTIDLNTIRIMGRNTLPAGEIARKYASERPREDRQLDFVLFLDGDRRTGKAREASEAEFIESISRPRALVEN